MKTKEELNELKLKFESLNKEIQELNDDELNAVTGGRTIVIMKGSISSVNSEQLNSVPTGQTYGKAGRIAIVGGADGPTAIFLDKISDK